MSCTSDVGHFEQNFGYKVLVSQLVFCVIIKDTISVIYVFFL